MNRPIRATLSLLAASSFACSPTVTPLAPAEGEVFETLDGETNLTAEVPAAFAFTPASGTSILPETFAATIQDRLLPPFDATPFFTAGAAGALGVGALPPGKYRLTGSVENDRGETGAGAVNFRVESPAETFVGGDNRFETIRADASCANPLHEALTDALLATGIFDPAVRPGHAPTYEEVLGGSPFTVDFGLAGFGAASIRVTLRPEVDSGGSIVFPPQVSLFGLSCIIGFDVYGDALRTSDRTVDIEFHAADFTTTDFGYYPPGCELMPWPIYGCDYRECETATVGFFDSLNPCEIAFELRGAPA